MKKAKSHNKPYKQAAFPPQQKKLNLKSPLEINTRVTINSEKSRMGSIRGNTQIRPDEVYEVFLSSQHRRKGFISTEDRIFSISPYVQRNYVGQNDSESCGNNLSEFKLMSMKHGNQLRNKSKKSGGLDNPKNLSFLQEKKHRKQLEIEKLRRLKKEDEKRKMELKLEEEKRKKKEKEKEEQRKKLIQDMEEERQKQLEMEAKEHEKRLQIEEEKRKQLEIEAEELRKQLALEAEERKKQYEMEEERRRKLELEEEERRKQLELENEKKRQSDQEKIDKIKALIDEEERKRKIQEEEDLRKSLAEQEEQKRQYDLLKQQLEEEERKRQEEYLKRKNEEEERKKLKELQKQKLLEEKEKMKGKHLSLAELNPLIQKFINELFYNQVCETSIFNNIIQTIKSLDGKCIKLMIRGLKHGIRENVDEDKYNKVLDHVYGHAMILEN